MKGFDLFISHAGEDADFVERLVAALEDHGLTVWLAAQQIQLGDDIRLEMEKGLRQSRFGVVVVSPSFFRKYWPEQELSALSSLEQAFGEKRILPVVHDLTEQEVAERWKFLASRQVVYSSEGLDIVVEKVCAAVGEPRGVTKAPSRLYGVPGTRSVKFIGREHELASIEKLLEGQGSKRIAVSLEGLPGIGKTELALQLVHRLSQNGSFPGGIFWFNAKDPDLRPTWGSTIADGLNIPGGKGRMLERATQAVRNVSRRMAPTLLVFDNVEIWKEEHQPQPLPEGAHLRYLLTAHERDVGGTAFEHVEVGFLDPEFVERLLRSISGRALAGVQGYQDLIKYLGGHALAVELAGVFLGQYPDETPLSYLEKLRDGGEIEAEVSEYVRYNRTVTQAFKTLWDRLDEHTRNLWRLAACFEPELVGPKLAEVVGVTSRDQRLLRQLHLIEKDDQGRWRMHRLTRDFGLRNGSDRELASAREGFVRGCAKLVRKTELETGFRLYLENKVHLDEAVRIAPEVLGPEDLRMFEFQSDIETGRHSAGDLVGAKKLGRQTLESALEVLGEDHPITAKKRSNLALVLKDLGDPAGAKQLLERALSSVGDLGEDHTLVTDWRASLAMALRDLGDLVGAKALLEKSLATDLRVLGEDHSTVARNRSRLGMVLKDMKDLAGAKELFEIALATDLKNLDENHPTVARRRSDLALVLVALGEPARARDLFEKALASARRNFGEEHWDVAKCRLNIARLAQRLEGLEDAKRHLSEALDSALESLGEEHPNVAMYRSNLASVLADLGEFSEARPLAQKALETAARQPKRSIVRTRVEAATREVLERCKHHCRKALVSALELFGEGHPDVAIYLSDLASVLASLGETQEARELAQEALEAAAQLPEESVARTRVEAAMQRVLGH